MIVLGLFCLVVSRVFVYHTFVSFILFPDIYTYLIWDVEPIPYHVPCGGFCISSANTGPQVLHVDPRCQATPGPRTGSDAHLVDGRRGAELSPWFSFSPSLAPS